MCGLWVPTDPTSYGCFFREVEFSWCGACLQLQTSHFAPKPSQAGMEIPTKPQEEGGLNLGCLRCFCADVYGRFLLSLLTLEVWAPASALSKGTQFPTHHQKTNSINSWWKKSGETPSVRKRCFVKILSAWYNIWWRSSERLMSTCFILLMSKYLI